MGGCRGPAPPPTPPTQSQTCPPVVTVARGAHKHGTSRNHCWHCPFTTSGDDLSNTVFTRLGSPLLVFWTSKYQSNLVFWTSKYQISLVFLSPKYQNSLVFLKIRFWYFGDLAFGTCQTKSLGRFGNEIDKRSILNNVSWFLFGFSVLVQKPQIQNNKVLRLQPFLVFSQRRSSQFVCHVWFFDLRNTKSKRRKKPNCRAQNTKCGKQQTAYSEVQKQAPGRLGKARGLRFQEGRGGEKGKTPTTGRRPSKSITDLPRTLTVLGSEVRH